MTNRLIKEFGPNVYTFAVHKISIILTYKQFNNIQQWRLADIGFFYGGCYVDNKSP